MTHEALIKMTILLVAVLWMKDSVPTIVYYTGA